MQEINIPQGTKEKFEGLIDINLWDKLIERDDSHIIYYEATGKLNNNWINDNSISHEFANGKGEIKLKDSVTKIGDDAFLECEGLSSINIPNSVTEIGASAFSCCGGLTSINISDSVSKIGYRAFSGCCSLKVIIVPKGTKEEFMSLLKKDLWDKLVDSNNSHTIYYEAKGKLNNKWIKGNSFSHTFKNGNGIIKLNAIVTKIGFEAFKNCNDLKSIIIPDSINHFCSYAFYGCTQLTSIEIPNTVTEIDNSTFYNCNSLVSIKIPNSLTDIGDNAFYGCEKLTKETKEIIRNINENAFDW